MIDVPYLVLSYVVTKIDDVSKSNIERMAIRLSTPESDVSITVRL